MEVVNSAFDLQKKQILSKMDLSRKGSIDEPIEDLIASINQSKDFCTSSSCSGRVVVFVEGNKKGCQWITNCHQPPVFDSKLFETLEQRKDETIVLKFEPFIVHIQCRSLQSARSFHMIAAESGFRNSGLTVGKHAKITLAIRSTLCLEIPLTGNESVLVSEAYLRYIFDEVVRRKFEQNTNMTKKLIQNAEDFLMSQ